MLRRSQQRVDLGVSRRGVADSGGNERRVSISHLDTDLKPVMCVWVEWYGLRATEEFHLARAASACKPTGSTFYRPQTTGGPLPGRFPFPFPSPPRYPLTHLLHEAQLKQLVSLVQDKVSVEDRGPGLRHITYIHALQETSYYRNAVECSASSTIPSPVAVG